MKPYAASCEQNREPILSVLSQLLPKASNVLEVGTGTGQHAVYFAEKLPHLTWQCSDQVQYHAGIQQWLDEAGLANVKPPLPLNVSTDSWPTQKFDALFSANVTHIMHWDNVVDFFKHGADCIRQGGLMICYGPFNKAGQFTSQSNAQFDMSLRMGDPNSGIRNFEDLVSLAETNHLVFSQEIDMPANNKILVWQKQ